MTSKRRILRRAAASSLLVASIVLIVAGSVAKHRVYEEDELAAEFGMETFTKISERQMVIDATFGGVQRREGKLFTTYDRFAPRTKRLCPT